MKTRIENVWIHDGIHPGFKGAVDLEEGRIVRVCSKTDVRPENSETDRLVDGQGRHLMPGMIDIHLHGGYGHDFIRDPEKGLKVNASNLVKEGCTSFMASLTVIDHASMISLLKEYASLPDDLLDPQRDAAFLGIHSEGPYLSQDYKALMDPVCLKDPDLDEFNEMKETARGLLKIMTIAPERKGATVLIESQKNTKDAPVFMIGHSAASCAQALDGLKAGASGFTHLYNAMSQHEHRNPGCVTAALLDDGSFCELIVDGFHVHPDIVRATWKVSGPERTVLITDAMPGKGMEDGEYIFSKLNCVKKGNTVRVKETGRIAGSAITMLDAIQNMKKFTGAGFDDLARISSYNPALLTGTDHIKGSIEPGKDADLILVDENLDLLQVWIHGNPVLQ